METLSSGLKKLEGSDNATRENFNEAIIEPTDALFHDTFGHKHTGIDGDAPKIAASGLADGAATDTIIGNRTIDDTMTATNGADTPTRLWSKLANMVKQITGKSSWYTAPAVSIETLNARTEDATTSTKGIVQLENSTTSTSTTRAATPASVKVAKDAADAVGSAQAAHVADNAKHIPHLGTTTNVGNVYSVTTSEVIAANQKFTVKINAASTGTATLNVSSIGSTKGIKKPGGTNATLKIGVYTFFHDGVNFQLLGEGGDYGTAGAAQVLDTHTVGRESGVEQGTIPVIGADLPHIGFSSFATRLNVLAPIGYYNGSRYIQVDDPNYKPANIPLGISMFGMDGSFVPEGMTSTQKGSIGFNTSSQTVTITAVDLTRAIVYAEVMGTSGDRPQNFVSIQLTNATTITIERGIGIGSVTVYWRVVEFDNVKSLQRGSTVMTSGGGGNAAYGGATITIAEVDTNKAMIFHSTKVAYGSSDLGPSGVYSNFNNSTTVTFVAYWLASQTITHQYQIIEFN